MHGHRRRSRASRAASISGFSKKKGKHTLTATATNGAGLTSTAKFTYKIL